MLTYAIAISLRDLEIGEKIYSFIEYVLADKKDMIMTYGQKLQQEGRMQGLEEGFVRGMKKVMEEGVVAGIQKSIQQGVEKGMFHIAKSMMKEGLSMYAIQKVTGLSEGEPEKL
jgi:predicted transposase YdaD